MFICLHYNNLYTIMAQHCEYHSTTMLFILKNFLQIDKHNISTNILYYTLYLTHFLIYYYDEEHLILYYLFIFHFVWMPPYCFLSFCFCFGVTPGCSQGPYWSAGDQTRPAKQVPYLHAPRAEFLFFC